MSIDVTVDYRNFSRYLQEAAKAASLPEKKRYFKNAGAIILRMEQGIFKSQGADLGKHWAPLSSATIAIRKKRRNLRGKRSTGMLPLQDTGMLRMSVSSGSTERGATGSIREIRPLELLMGTRLKYAATHQYGRGPMTIQNVKIRGHTRRLKGGTRGVSSRIAFVKPHMRTQHWGAVPARPFVGWTNWGVERVVQEAYRHFVEIPDERSR